MHATTTTALALLASTGALAQSTSVTSWFNMGFDNDPVASVIGVSGNAVTYAIACAPDTDADDCGLYPSMTITAGPATLAYSYTVQTDSASVATDLEDEYDTYGNEFLIDCKLDGTTRASCHASVGGKNAKAPTDTTTTLASEDMSFGPLTITAGLERLAARTASASASGASSTGASGKASSGSGSATAKATSAAKSGEESSSASATASPSAGGAGHFAAPLLAVAGVAAAAFAL